MKTFTLAGREIKVKPATLFQLAELEEQGPLEQKQNKPITALLDVLKLVISDKDLNPDLDENWIKDISPSEMDVLNEVVTYFLVVNSPDIK
jgi:hypothetical protein